ncbi:rRNA maturation RNAse YbeY [Desulfovibrio sp. OttesenSCG-928-C06]|nr:rRNA maturation RNAse YbeY [Desulfovibrio sp. OttesenSCG-928-C06]
MRISLDYDSSTVWKLPFAPSELEEALRLMWSVFRRRYDEDGAVAENPLDLEGMSRAGVSLELALVDEPEMDRLNREFLNCCGPTNVLAFPAPEAAAWVIDSANNAPGGSGLHKGETADSAGDSGNNNSAAGCSGPAGSSNTPRQGGSLSIFGALPLMPEDTAYLGWLALAPDTMRREAVLYGQELGAHTLRLLAHGFAHLLGYEHGEAMDNASNSAAEAALRHLA